ncbi:histidine phosphatase family protein [Acidiferrimicrobium sp. IK]|uniref:histidine phosphatase family protein n=1 Tax=Acidiferrimicrobium sp. IK TaxID=2871700 RepID=UPI0021CB0BD0|nr:histidine phosphatase family protein [Acidiferrimicrobium sp. IK]MCU4183074.1 histidine phosphatase family protein [Acidiferrimicrobium sp. IK]
MSAPGPIVTLIRHGETEWSKSGQHTGRSDIPLTAAGERQAKEIATLIDSDAFSAVLVSPMQRAQRTATLAGLEDFEVVDDLREWDYGDFEGLASAEIRDRVPGWSIWAGPWRGGESASDVTARADRVIERILALPADARVALVGHGHMSRVLGARWMGSAVTAGQRLALDTGAVCELGWEHDYRVLHRWNVVAGATIGR